MAAQRCTYKSGYNTMLCQQKRLSGEKLHLLLLGHGIRWKKSSRFLIAYLQGVFSAIMFTCYPFEKPVTSYTCMYVSSSSGSGSYRLPNLFYYLPTGL